MVDIQRRQTTVLHVGGMYRATEKAVVEEALRRRPGVLAVEADPVAQTACVTFDSQRTSVAELRRWVRECRMHCAGRSVPGHICDPLAEEGAPHAAHAPPRAVVIDEVVAEVPPADKAAATVARLQSEGRTVAIGRGTSRKTRQNLAWAVGYNSLALPVAAGVSEPLGFVLRPEVGAISMAGSSVIVALNAVSLKRLPLDREVPGD